MRNRRRPAPVTAWTRRSQRWRLAPRWWPSTWRPRRSKPISIPPCVPRAALLGRSPFPRRRGNPGAGGAAGAPGVSQPLAAPTGAPAPPRRRNAPAHGPRTGGQTGAQRRSCPGPKAPWTQVLAPVGAPRQRRSLGGRWAYRSRAQQLASGASAGCWRRAAQAGRPFRRPIVCGSSRWAVAASAADGRSTKIPPAALYASERAAAPHLAENPIVAYYAGVVAFRGGQEHGAADLAAFGRCKDSELSLVSSKQRTAAA